MMRRLFVIVGTLIWWRLGPDTDHATYTAADLLRRKG